MTPNILKRLYRGLRYRRRKDPRSGFKPTLGVVIYDRDGNVKQRQVYPVQTFHVNFFHLWYASAVEIYPHNVVDIDGNTKSIGYQDQMPIWDMDVNAADEDGGIAVGTGTGAIDQRDTELGTPIAHGVGGGQLTYGGMGFGQGIFDEDSSPNTYVMPVYRGFGNGSGGSITVREVGMYAEHFENPNLHPTFLIERTLVNFTLTDGDSCVITYYIGVSK